MSEENPEPFNTSPKVASAGYLRGPDTAVYAELSDEAFTKVWGVAGEEIGSQFRWSESFPSWEDVAGEVITFEELGVKEKLIGTEALLNSLI
ncbi:hscarg dehydrogenase [Colletotrichum sojae]|uniref:Hscarg dehydrogenase n=1 Tax=Colletotrichum sojae TaxID=2175907 RepID=A0A8H6N0P6_9PEZI|nr:hscarg dehydrogenase [Colletotrichum sojae]